MVLSKLGHSHPWGGPSLHFLLIPTDQASGPPLPVSKAWGLIPTPVMGTYSLAQGHIHQVHSSMR